MMNVGILESIICFCPSQPKQRELMFDCSELNNLGDVLAAFSIFTDDRMYRNAPFSVKLKSKLKCFTVQPTMLLYIIYAISAII